MRKLWICALVFAMIFSVGTGNALAPPQEELKLTAENATVSPGNTATVAVVVENTGNQTVGGNYKVEANASALPRSWSATANETVVRGPLAPNATRTANVSVEVPANATAGAHRVSLALVTENRTWATTNTTVHVAETATTTTEDSDESRDDADNRDDRTTNLDENTSGGGGFPVAAAGGGSSTWWESILEFFTTPVGAVVLVALAGLFLFSQRS